MTVGKQILLIEVIVTDDDAEPPAEWNWNQLVSGGGDSVKVLWAGPYGDAPEEGFEN